MIDSFPINVQPHLGSGEDRWLYILALLMNHDEWSMEQPNTLVHNSSGLWLRPQINESFQYGRGQTLFGLIDDDDHQLEVNFARVIKHLIMPQLDELDVILKLSVTELPDAEIYTSRGRYNREQRRRQQIANQVIAMGGAGGGHVGSGGINGISAGGGSYSLGGLGAALQHTPQQTPPSKKKSISEFFRSKR